MSAPTHHRPIFRAALAALAAATVVAACGGDDDNNNSPQVPSTGSTTPYVGTKGPDLSTPMPGGPQHTVLNNQPTSPAVNNAPPGSAGSG